MKQFLLAASAAVVMISCNNDATVAGSHDDHDNNMASTNTEHMKDVYRAIETGDVSKLDSFMAEDVVDHNGNMDGSDVKGRDSVKAFISRMHTYIDGLKMELQSDATSADGNYHYGLVRMTGTAKANPWGMPVGQKVDDTSVDVVKLRDGKATDHWGFMSMADMQEMMGAMKGGMPPPMKDTTKAK